MPLRCLHQQCSKSSLHSKWFLERITVTEVCKLPVFITCIEQCCRHSDDARCDHFCNFAGAKKLAQVRENSNFFRDELRKMGCEVLGDEGSPVMPIMLYNPGKIPAFSRECLKRNVCFPIPVLWIKLCLLPTVLMSHIQGPSSVKTPWHCRGSHAAVKIVVPLKR
jgi:hypothetical protein